MENGISFDPVAMDEAIRCAKVADANVLSGTDFKSLQSKLGNINEVDSISGVIDSASSIQEELSVIKNLPINLERIKQEGLNSYLTETLNIGSYSKMGTFYDQTDPIYKDIKYGGGTLYSDGCGFFSLLSVITANTGKKFNYNEIKDLAAIANEERGLSNVERMETLATYLGNIYGFTYSKGPIDELKETLKNGGAAIAFTPNSTSSSGHIIPITGILSNGNIVVNDSWNLSEDRQLRIDQLGFNLNNGEIKISVAGADKDGDGRNDDLWYFNFNNKKPYNTYSLSNDISEVPKYYQSDYNDIKYGGGTIKSAGCGLVCLAMVDSYYNGAKGKTEREVIEELAKKYGNAYADKKTGRSSYGLFQDTSEELNLPYEEYIHYANEKSFDQVVEKLEEGAVVVGLAKGSSIFTKGGHFVVLTGVTDDGNIIVNDPNKYNHIEFTKWPGKTGAGERLTNGFENGFNKEEFLYGKFERFWVYGPKDGASTPNASTSENTLSSFNNSAFSELLFKSDDTVSTVNLNSSENETTTTLTTLTTPITSKGDDLSSEPSTLTVSSNSDSSASTSNLSSSSSSSNSSSSVSISNLSSSSGSSNTGSSVSASKPSSSSGSSNSGSSVNTSKPTSSSGSSNSGSSVSASKPSSSSGSSNSGSSVSASKPSSSLGESIINILPDNKFSEVLPQLSKGNLGSMEISNNSVIYEVFNVNNSTYGDYVQSLLDAGYIMSGNGTFIKGNYEVVALITKDGNMSIKLNVINLKSNL